MVGQFKKGLAIIVIIISVIVFYFPLLASSKTPIPTDTIVGLYHPFRDYFSDEYPNGIPFKNFLITDPVRQTYVWKELAIDVMSSLQIPTWNPYEMTGKPLLANFQSSIFYPLNLILFIKPFYYSWSAFVVLQSVLMGIFMFVFLKNLKLKEGPALIGTISFVFSGFSISWLEWGTVLHTGLWLPLILFSIDKLVEKPTMKSAALICLSLIFSFFGGHLQIFFYTLLFVVAYFLYRLKKDIKQKLLYFGGAILMFILLASIQWIPTLQFILLSARSYDQNFQNAEGWFIPFRHLIQFVAPDFFGNPTTLNYWGVWNYGELTGYIGIGALMLCLYSLFRNRKPLFFWVAIAVSLLFALPTGISHVPYLLNVPFLASAQPTRLLFIVIFCLCTLSAFGLDYLLQIKKFKKHHLLPLGAILTITFFLWGLVLLKPISFFPDIMSVDTAKRNLILPTILIGFVTFYLILLIVPKLVKLRSFIMSLLVVVVLFDLLRFGQKFTTFSQVDYLFPQTEITKYLIENAGIERVAILDRRILPPNFLTHYKIQTIEGYDPLYLKDYAEVIILMERGKPDIRPPYGFNRIITPHAYNSHLFDFLGTRYVLSLEDIRSEKLEKIMQEGSTRLYVNKKAFDRAFFVDEVIKYDHPGQLLSGNLRTTAYIADVRPSDYKTLEKGSVLTQKYTENEIDLVTRNEGDGFLVLTDAFYPSWKVYIDGKESKIYKTNHAFRGIFVPKGEHAIQLKVGLF